MVVTGVTDCLTVAGVWVRPFYVPERASDRPVTMSEKPFWRKAARHPRADRSLGKAAPMNLTNPDREKTQQPTCPECGSALTTENFGSAGEGDYIVYACPICAEIHGSKGDSIVYEPIWKDKPAPAPTSMTNTELIPLTAWLAQALQVEGYNVIPDWHYPALGAAKRPTSSSTRATLRNATASAAGSVTTTSAGRTPAANNSSPPAAAISWNCSHSNPRSRKRSARCSQWKIPED